MSIEFFKIIVHPLLRIVFFSNTANFENVFGNFLREKFEQTTILTLVSL